MALDIGVTNGLPTYSWIQTRNKNNYSSVYALALNPTGGRVGIGTTLPDAILDVYGTGIFNSAIIVPRDSTANRPISPRNGMIRYNTDTAALEGYANDTWGSLGGSASFPLLASPIGSAGAPAYSFTSDSGTGLYSPGSGIVALSNQMPANACGSIPQGT